MIQLLDLAPEVLHNIFQSVVTEDLASLSRTCHLLNKIIQNDDLLWKIHFGARFAFSTTDEPCSWRARLSRLVAVQKILDAEDETVKAREESLDEVLNQTIRLLEQSAFASPAVNDLLSTSFQQPSNIAHFLCKSSLFGRARPGIWHAAPTTDLQQISAQLHVLGGMNLEGQWPCLDELIAPDESDEAGNPGLRLQPVRHLHPFARSRVYDLRRYTRPNLWGPFMDDGSQRVDWEKMQAIMIVIAFNHRMYNERRPFAASTIMGSPPSDWSGSPTSASSSSSPSRSNSATVQSVLQPWEQPFQGIAPHSYSSLPLAGPYIKPPRPDLVPLDPYGVTGTWIRIVCFLDYNDLHAFNFEGGDIADDQEREPISTREAFRLIRLQLTVTQIEPPGEGDGQDLPVVHFEGTSKSTIMAWDPNANSRIRGTVRQTPEGAIRWTTFSVFHGEEKWRSEGVQVGGIQSSRGILGNWFDKDYERRGPAGPTAFWKISDDMIEERRSMQQMVQIFLAAQGD